MSFMNYGYLTYTLSKKIFADRGMDFDHEVFRTSEGGYSNIGVLFSDNCPVIIKAASFSGDFGSALRSVNEFMGPVVMQIDQCTNYVAGMLPGTSYLNGIRREYVSAVPVKALKETITNAVVNKNYENSSPVTVSVCADKVIVSVSCPKPDSGLRKIFSRLGCIAKAHEITDCCYSNADVKPDFVLTEEVFTATLPFISSEKLSRYFDNISGK